MKYTMGRESLLSRLTHPNFVNIQISIVLFVYINTLVYRDSVLSGIKEMPVA